MIELSGLYLKAYTQCTPTSANSDFGYVTLCDTTATMVLHQEKIQPALTVFGVFGCLWEHLARSKNLEKC